MALRVGDCIEAARFEHPSFTVQVIPSSIAARIANKIQRRLLFETHQRNASYLVRTWVIALLPSQNLATFGAGAAQGAPILEGSTDFEVSTTPAGALAQVDLNATTLVAARAATSGSLDTLVDSTRAWVPGAYVDALVQIVEGPGKGQVAVIDTNDTTSLAIVGNWITAPTEASIYRIQRNAFAADGSMSVQLGTVPATSAAQGWLVKLDAQGQPYLDLANPVSVPMTSGIPIPPSFHLLHGSWYGLAGQQNLDGYPQPFTLVEPIDRHQPARSYAGYVQGEQLYLCAPMSQWRNVSRIEIPYLPLAPKIVTAQDLLILPDAAEEAMVAGIALAMAERAAVYGQAGIDLTDFQARQNQMIDLYIQHVAGAGRAKAGRIKDVW